MVWRPIAGPGENLAEDVCGNVDAKEKLPHRGEVTAHAGLWRLLKEGDIVLRNRGETAGICDVVERAVRVGASINSTGGNARPRTWAPTRSRSAAVPLARGDSRTPH